MSRIGLKPIAFSDSIIVDINGGFVNAKGAFGAGSCAIMSGVVATLSKNVITLSRDDKVSSSIFGLCRSNIANLIYGVDKGFLIELELVGVGYKAGLKGRYLFLYLGYSHDTYIRVPDGIFVEAGSTNIKISGVYKEDVGQFAAFVIAQRPSEPYKGRGIKIKGSSIVMKEGKK